MTTEMLRSVCLCMGLTVSLARAADWPQWRGPNRDGIATETGLLTRWPEGGPVRLWQVDLPGEGYSSPSVADGTIYITGNTGNKQDRMGFLYALDVANGALRWQTGFGREWSKNYAFARTTPTVHGGRVYTIASQGLVACCDAQTGRTIWTVDMLQRFKGVNTAWGIAESPLIHGRMLICQPGGPDAAVAALDIDTGATIWTSRGLSDKSAYCSPMLLEVGGRMQLVTQTANHVVGLDPDSGQVLWKHAHRNRHAVHPNTPLVVDGNKVFVASGYGYGAELLAIRDGTVTRVWHNPQADNHFQGFILVKGRIVCPSRNINVLDPATGAAVYRVQEARKPQVTMTAQGLIAYDEGGTIWLIDLQAERYAILGRLKVDFGNGQHWSTPTLANGILVVRRGKGVAAFDLRTKP
jgi:outer membrane protein assembly factor BamB